MSSEDDLTGHQLGQYRLESCIAQGGMATIYRVTHLGLNKAMALKVLLPAFAQDREFLERFRREAQGAAQLDHPNIVRIYDTGEAAGYQYIAMEYVEGGSLAGRMANQKGPLPLEQVLDVLTQLASALDYAHRRGAVHRDVKPSNILVRQDGQVLLTDFGIARAAWETRLTRTGTLLGTPAYMAPEQALGRQANKRTDIYALGVILYEMVTGRPPFEGAGEAVLYQHVHESGRAPQELNPTVPPGGGRVILRALEKTPSRRYSTAGELASAFRQAVAKPMTEDAATIVRVPKQSARSLPGSLSRGWMLVGLSAAFILALLVYGAARLFPRQAGPAATATRIIQTSPTSLSSFPRSTPLPLTPTSPPQPTSTPLPSPAPATEETPQSSGGTEYCVVPSWNPQAPPDFPANAVDPNTCEGIGLSLGVGEHIWVPNENVHRDCRTNKIIQVAYRDRRYWMHVHRIGRPAADGTCQPIPNWRDFFAAPRQ